MADTKHKEKIMRKATAKWDGRKIPLSFPYLPVLMQGRTEHGEEDPKHPPMDRGHRAKIFAPFDALDGFSAEIRKKDRLFEETAPEKTEGNTDGFPDDP